MILRKDADGYVRDENGDAYGQTDLDVFWSLYREFNVPHRPAMSMTNSLFNGATIFVALDDGHYNWTWEIV